MGKLITKILFFISVGLLMTACSVTEKIPEGEYYLKENNYTIEDGKAFKGELDDYVPLKPNNRLLGFIPVKDWAYNQIPYELDSVFSDYYKYKKTVRSQKLLDSLYRVHHLPQYVGEGKWLKRTVYKQGEEPILLDSLSAYDAAQTLQDFYFERGYFDAEVNPEFKTNKKRKKGSITYNIKLNEPSKLTAYEQNISNQNMLSLYEENKADSNVEINTRLDYRDLEAESERLTLLYKNNGYYDFNKLGQDLIFRIDSTESKQLKATLKIAKSEFDSIQEFKQYYFGDINVYTDNTANTNHQEEHLGYNILSGEETKFKPRVYTDALTIEKGDLYSLEKTGETRQLIFNRNNFNLMKMDVRKQSDNPDDSLLVADIYLRPMKKYDLELFFEGSYSEFLNLGLSPGLRLLTRNIFRGGENLEFNVKGTFGTVNNEENKIFNARELIFESKLTFPRLLLPFNTEGLLPKNYNPNSTFTLAASEQQNIGLGSRNYSMSLDYAISPGMSKHDLKLLHFQYVKNTEKNKYYNIFTLDGDVKDNTFDTYFVYDPTIEQQFENGEISQDDLELLIYNDNNFPNNLPINTYNFDDYTDYRNMIFRKSSITQDVLIQSLTYGYTYNQDGNKKYKHPFFLNAKVEAAGLLLGGLDAIFGFDEIENFDGSNARSLAGVQYSQFLKFDLNIRKIFHLNKKSAVALRSFTGLAMPYGKSDFIPFSKSFFGGGSNDVRAWKAFELSPNPLRPNDGGTYIDNFKLTWNAEFRHKLSSLFEGALFVDAGNIWSTNSDNPNRQFKLNKFLGQLGIGAGVGLRLDFDYFLMRFDFAYKMHDPAYPESNRWFNNVNLLKPQFQFGVNYPF